LNHVLQGKCGYYMELVFMSKNYDVVWRIADRVIGAIASTEYDRDE
jgi:hypothetical protein